jgi:membrane peptidoglycan carboxypeptidase
MPSAQHTRNLLGLLGAFVVTSMAGGVLAAGLAMPAVGASGIMTKNSASFFDSLPGELKQPPLSAQSKLLAADGSLITTFYDENRVLVPLSKMSVNIQEAVVAIEDSRFYDHGGVDPQGLARAAVVNKVSNGVAQGASTLTQQYVKNVLLEAAEARDDKKAKNKAVEVSAARKIQEIRYAVSLEKQLGPNGKKEILHRYLNIAWFGRKINGVEAASKYYFGTTAAKLTLPQAATLAGMIQAPMKYNPQSAPKEALKRRNVVLHRMLELHKIDQKTHDLAVKAKLSPKITPSANGCANADKTYQQYCNYVRQLIIENKDFSSLGKTRDARRKTLYRGGLTIKTAMDPKIVKVAYKTLRKKIPPKDESGIATASVTVEPGTGDVLSIMQNKTYNPLGDKRRGDTALNYSVDNAYGGASGFQTGSTFKPFTLAAWLDAGKSLNTQLPAGAGNASFREFRACGSTLSSNERYKYTNSDDGGSSGTTMSVWDGTAQSVNGVFISMEKQLDLCKIRSIAEDIGVHLAKPRDQFCTRKEGDVTIRLPFCVPSLTLGVADISPMTMAAAYAAFAADGKFCKPTAVVSVKDRNGKPVDIPRADCKQTLDKEVARGVNLGLSRALTNGTAASVGPLQGRPASGKTGTTNSSVDTWFVGYTPQLATAVWVGDPKIYPHKDYRGRTTWSRKSMNGRRIGGQYFPKVYGAYLAAPMWKTIMESASKGLPVERFTRPGGKYLVSPKKEVPDVDGKSVDEAESTLEAAGFSVSKSNDPVGSQYPSGSVASTSPAGGSMASTGSSVTINISKGGGGAPANGAGGRGGRGGGRRGGGGGGNLVVPTAD